MDLNRAATFLRVVESGGFSSAATALGLPPSSVSRSVAKLELELGVTLLERTTRKVALTEAGRAYFERVREALAGLDEANALALDAAREPRGVVRLGVPPTFAPMMASSIATFVAAHPRVEIEVIASARAGNLVGEAVDLALVIGRQPSSSLVSRRIGNVEQRLYASPGYLAHRGTPLELEELRRPRDPRVRAAHTAITLHGNPSGDLWELTGPDGEVTIEVQAQVRGDHDGFMIEAAVAGLGIALVPTLPAEIHVTRGALVPVLPSYGASFALQLLTPTSRLVARRTALFRDHLAQVWSGRCSKAGCSAG